MAGSYESMTLGDPNRVKRYLHRRRYAEAIKRMNTVSDEPHVLDYGAGNGQVVNGLLERYPKARVTLFEPAQKFQDEIRLNTAKFGNRVRVVTDTDDIERGVFSNILCLSVFEHLPKPLIKESLAVLHDVSDEDTNILVEVPNELYVGALLKGMLRHVRRPDNFDGDLRNIAGATAGHPPTERPLSDIDPSVGLPWHGHHMGFDHREFQGVLEEGGLFHTTNPSFAPIDFLGKFASLDVYFELQKIQEKTEV